MPNWCNTSLVFEGDKQEIKTLYQTMKRLKTALVQTGWDALSKPWVAIGKKPIAEAHGFLWNVKGIFCVWKPKLLGHPASKHTTSSVKNFHH